LLTIGASGSVSNYQLLLLGRQAAFVYNWFSADETGISDIGSCSWGVGIAFLDFLSRQRGLSRSSRPATAVFLTRRTVRKLFSAPEVETTDPLPQKSSAAFVR